MGELSLSQDQIAQLVTAIQNSQMTYAAARGPTDPQASPYGRAGVPAGFTVAPNGTLYAPRAASSPPAARLDRPLAFLWTPVNLPLVGEVPVGTALSFAAFLGWLVFGGRS